MQRMRREGVEWFQGEAFVDLRWVCAEGFLFLATVTHCEKAMSKGVLSARRSARAAMPRARPGHGLAAFPSSATGLALFTWMLLAMPREAAPLLSIANCSADRTTLDGNQCQCPAGS